VLVDDHGDLRVLRLQDLQQLRDGNALGHGLDRADAQVFHRAVGRQRVEVLHMHEADDAVLVAAAHGIARVLVLHDERQVLLERILKVEADDVGARRHDGLGVLVAQVEDVVHVLVLLGIDEAALGALVDEQLDLLVGVHLVLVGDVVAEQLHNPVRDAVEQPHDGVRDAVEPHERRGGEQGVALRGEDGERLRYELAHHDMQRGDDDEADGDGNAVDGRLGQADRQQRTLDELGDGGLAQPAQGERGQRDAQLAGGEVGVHVVGHEFGVLGAGAVLVDEDLHLGLAHPHERELGGDEESVHEQEEKDKKKA